MFNDGDTMDHAKLICILVMAVACAEGPALRPSAPAPSGVRASCERGCPNATSPVVGLDLPERSKLLGRLWARGYQVYACEQDASGSWKWNVEPDAQLFTDAEGLSPWGRHDAVEVNEGGTVRKFPEWTNVKGTFIGVKLQAAPSRNPGSAASLLIGRKEVRGSGDIAGVQNVVRNNPTGGQQPPATDCSADTPKDRRTQRVPYSTEYDFYGDCCPSEWIGPPAR
jgi:hypothetical protein